MQQVLEHIVSRSRAELAETMRAMPRAELETKLAGLPPCRDFRAALSAPGLRVIAELKAASPSKGVIRQPLEIENFAAQLEQAGAAALSVLTERNFFLGSEANLRRARATVAIPILRKDFIYDEYQILEARVWGADAVLLIAAMLDAAAFRRLHAFAVSLGLGVLCEAHTPAELDMLLANGAQIVGINARDLSTFDTSLALAGELIRRVPADCVPVAESAIRDRADMLELAELGARAFLIGETLMRAARPGEKLCELLSR